MSAKISKDLKSSGALINPHNRFLKQEEGEAFEDLQYEELEAVKSQFIEVYPKTIINKVTSQDIGLSYSMNPYQGCEHGCTYCYARPTHEYWGYSAGLDFERKILVKMNAADLLEQAFRKKNWEVRPVMLSGNTDCYQPCERRFGLTRKLLEVLLRFQHPVAVITKNALIERDADLLQELAALNLVSVNLSITSLDENLRRKLEPRTASASKKLQTIEALSKLNIPVNVMLAPVIPALNEEELFAICKASSEHGARSIHYQIVRLNGPNGDIFTSWLQHYYPDRAEKILNQLKSMHGGTLNDSTFGRRMRGEGLFAENIRQQFMLARKRFFPNYEPFHLRTDLFQVPDESGQMRMF